MEKAKGFGSLPRIQFEYFLTILVIISNLTIIGCSPPRNIPTKENDISLSLLNWSFLPEKSYRYAGNIVEEGDSRYLFTCSSLLRLDRPYEGVVGTPEYATAQNIVDHITMRRGYKYEGTWYWYDEDEVVVWPGEKTYPEEKIWDYRHVCDPSVISGVFWYEKPLDTKPEQYSYAMFYLGIEKSLPEGGSNEIGWAVAKNLWGPWYKVTGNGPLIPSYTPGHWGVGQPSAISLGSGSGSVRIFYTVADGNSVKMVVEDWYLNDANNPFKITPTSQLTTAGLENYNGDSDNALHAGELMFGGNKYWLIRNGHPYPTGGCSVVSDHLQVASIPADFNKNIVSGSQWQVELNIDQQLIDPNMSRGFDRVFGGGFVRDTEGSAVSPNYIEMVTSTANADCNGNDPFYSFWSYETHIVKKRI